eukprot:TRINITY_DN19422_c0_g1_i1.p1 TRINITY_DN19422_c0_g1~~TRINITY_DN19422_c0_g1_i1.p1  ORF type:complete len:825 (+),score=261.49 TRINITY_DN19422_c0_g1_i1:59-2476(+)
MPRPHAAFDDVGASAPGTPVSVNPLDSRGHAGVRCNDQRNVRLQELFAQHRGRDGAVPFGKLGSLLADVGFDWGSLGDRAVAGMDQAEALSFPGFLELVAALEAESQGQPDAQRYFEEVRRRVDHNKARDRLLAEAASPLFPSESPVRWSFDMAAVLVTGYHAATVPARAAGLADWGHLVPLEWVFTAVLLSDMVVSSRTACDLVHAAMPRRALLCYLRGWFPLDLVSALPFHLVARGAGCSPAVVACLEGTRLLRVLKFGGLFALTPSGFISPAVVWFKVTFLPYFMLLWWTLATVHWLAVVFIVVFDLGSADYVHAVYLVIETISTVGYGDVEVRTDAQKVFAVVLFVLGIVVNGYVVSGLTQLLVQADLSSDRSMVLKRTLAVLRQFSVPWAVQREVLSFQHHTLGSNAGSSFSEVTGHLPVTMRVQISTFLRLHIVNRVPQFEAATPECQVALAQALTEHVVSPGDEICVEGEEGHEMYFVMYGCAEVHTREGSSLAVLRGGSFFGHIALLHSKSKRTAGVTAITYCELLSLDKTDFDAIRSNFAKFDAVMEEAGKIGCHPETAAQQDPDSPASTTRTDAEPGSAQKQASDHLSPSRAPSGGNVSPRCLLRAAVDTTAIGSRTWSASPVSRRVSTGSLAASVTGQELRRGTQGSRCGLLQERHLAGRRFRSMHQIRLSASAAPREPGLPSFDALATSTTTEGPPEPQRDSPRRGEQLILRAMQAMQKDITALRESVAAVETSVTPPRELTAGQLTKLQSALGDPGLAGDSEIQAMCRDTTQSLRADDRDIAVLVSGCAEGK